MFLKVAASFTDQDYLQAQVCPCLVECCSSCRYVVLAKGVLQPRIDLAVLHRCLEHCTAWCYELQQCPQCNMLDSVRRGIAFVFYG